MTGCTQVKQLQNLDPLLTLKDFSDEKDEQAKWVEGELVKFHKLIASIDDGSIKKYTTQESIRQEFGEPVVIDHLREKDTTLERWLYRHPIQKLATERVYFYFDTDGRFVRFERAKHI